MTILMKSMTNDLKEKEKVQVYIESVDVAKRKISLGLVAMDKKNVIYK